MTTDSSDKTKAPDELEIPPASEAAPAADSPGRASNEASPVEPAISETTLDPGDKPKKPVRGRPFAPGQSGNPKGRPRGALGWKARAAKEILAGDLEDIMKVAIATAKRGNPVMMKFCLSLAMHQKDEPIEVDLPNLDSPAACRDAIGKLIQEALRGELPPAEARAAIDLVERRRMSFGATRPQLEFEAEYVQELVIDLIANFPLGKEGMMDFFSIYLMGKYLSSLELPQTVYNSVYRAFLDYAHQEFFKDWAIEDFVFELTETVKALEQRQADIERMGAEAYKQHIAELKASRKKKSLE